MFSFVLNRRFFGVLFLSITSVLAHGHEPENQFSLKIGDIRLGSLKANDIDYYDIEPPNADALVSFRLFGHIYAVGGADGVSTPYLKKPWLRLECSDNMNSFSNWSAITESHALNAEIETAHIQNARIEPGVHYRIAVGSDSSMEGRYALIADAADDGGEIEMEDLDLGFDPQGYRNSLSTAYSIPDLALPSGERIYAGTERGFTFCSEDDAQSWRQIYPPDNLTPHGTIYGLFADSQGIIYLSQWTSQDDVDNHGQHGCVEESRDGGNHWTKALQFEWPTGVAWRMAEDQQGNVFVGEYTATYNKGPEPLYTGNIWRRKNHGNNGESFEIVFANPSDNFDTFNNHVHYVGVDPYTDDVYATIGDGAVGRFVRSKQHGDLGTWETLERGVDAQYTAIVFTPDYLFLGMDTNKAYKKVVRWDKRTDSVKPDEKFRTTVSMDDPKQEPLPYFDRGNWFWGHFLPKAHMVLMLYLPYGVDRMIDNLAQSPRLYATPNYGETWKRAITFPPVPYGVQYGFYGPKLVSNVSPTGWIYAMRGTFSEQIHRGFRFRLKPDYVSAINGRWE